MMDADGKPVKRNFVHVSDLVESMILALDHPKACQQTFNICMDEPIDYQQVADYLRRNPRAFLRRDQNTLLVNLAR